MTRRTRTAAPYWQLPGGVMAYECAADMCTNIATIVVRGPKGCEWALCAADWHSLQRQTLGLMEIVRRHERPSCSQSDCQDDAAAVIDEPEAGSVPVCERHWTTFSWVSPSTPAVGSELATCWRRR
jgi:hypothetical protein